MNHLAEWLRLQLLLSLYYAQLKMLVYIEVIFLRHHLVALLYKQNSGTGKFCPTFN